MRTHHLAGATLLVMAFVTSVSAQSPTIQWTPFTYTSLAGETLAADTGRLAVPEDRSRPNGATIQLVAIRVRSTASRPGSPIVYLAGGPGASGTSGMRGDLFPTVAALREVSDVVIYDQRGTGFALPSLNVRGSLGVPLLSSVESPEALAAVIARAREAAAEVRSRGIDLAAYTTVASADDLDDLRKALGVERVILWGHSYGSHLGLAYLKRHGTHVERAMLGGINGLDQRRRYPQDGDVLFARLDSIIKTVPALRSAMPDFLGTTRRVLAKLAATPVRVAVDTQEVLVGKAELQMLIAIQSGEQGFVRRLPLTIAQIDAGDYAYVGRQVRDVIKARPLGTAMTYVMDMASGVSPERARRIAEQAPSALLGNAINFPFDVPAFRDAWAPRDLGAEFRAAFTSAVPTLFISGTLDGRTSLTDAEDVRRGFRNSAHVVLDGASHNPYALTTELRDLMLRFARGETVRDAHLRVPVELRGPDEATVIAELLGLARSQGGEAAVARFRALAAGGKESRYLSSFVPGDVFLPLWREGKRTEAEQILRAGVERYPENSFLLTRLAEVETARGNAPAAAEAYRRALSADPFNRMAAVQLAKAGGNP